MAFIRSDGCLKAGWKTGDRIFWHHAESDLQQGNGRVKSRTGKSGRSDSGSGRRFGHGLQQGDLNGGCDGQGRLGGILDLKRARLNFEPVPVGVIVTVVGTGSEVNGEGVITHEEQKN